MFKIFKALYSHMFVFICLYFDFVSQHLSCASIFMNFFPEMKNGKHSKRRRRNGVFFILFFYISRHTDQRYLKILHAEVQEGKRDYKYNDYIVRLAGTWKIHVFNYRKFVKHAM